MPTTTPRRLRVEADGGSRGNPGVAGYGAVVRGEDGAVLAERAAPLGTASNNVAEYSGLIAGLEAATLIDPGADITVAMDSKLVVEQMSGRWKIKHPDMKTLALRARALADAITAAGGSVRYTWIPRAQNAAADKLSNDGMDGRTIVRGPGMDSATPDMDEARPAGEGRERESGEPKGRQETGHEGKGARGEGAAYLLPSDPFPRGEPTRIVLVRHGVTALTETGRLDGRGGLDPSLSDLGREQAAHAARLVAELVAGAAVTVTTSTLARAVETGSAVAAALGVGATADDRWDEQNFGDWDGAVLADLVRSDPSALGHLRADATYARPGGESHLQLRERVLEAYAARAAAGGIQVVVCHRKPIMVVLAEILGVGMERQWRIAAGPGSLTAIEAWANGAASVVFTNRR